VRIGHGTFDSLLAERPEAYVLVDSFFAARFADVPRTLLVEATEEHKTLGCVETLIGRLRDLGATRRDELVAVGGGIVQDVATGAASLYMRGLPWSYAPTTVLAMTDSCIGGKSSLNVGPYKNLAGNFHPPHRVVIDPMFIDTLPAEARAGGLCEAMKICFCRGPEAFAGYLQRYADFAGDPDTAPALLHHSLDAKRWFIEIDEFDRGERRLLNFGHTFGHALEAASAFAISHGIAIGVGVLCAERLAVGLEGERAAQPELTAHALQLVGQAPGLRERLDGVDPDHFDRAFLSDKKHGHGDLHLILPSGGGGVAERVLPRDAHVLDAVREARAEATRMVAA